MTAGVDLVVGRRAFQRAVTLVLCRHHDLESLGVVLVAFVFGAIVLVGVAFTDVVGELRLPIIIELINA